MQTKELSTYERDKKNNKTVLIYLSVLIVVLLGANLWYLISNNNKWGKILNFKDETTVTPTVNLVVPGRLEITSPTLDANISRSGGIIKLEGKMQGFFEGLVNYRIVDANGELILEGIATAAGENYEQMADFSDIIFLDTPVTYGLSEMVELVLYEVSMKDGSEKELLKIEINVVD